MTKIFCFSERKSINDTLRRCGLLAEWMHSLTFFSAVDFDGFDEELFWNHGKIVEKEFPEMFEHFKEIFEQRLEEGY